MLTTLFLFSACATSSAPQVPSGPKVNLPPPKDSNGVVDYFFTALKIRDFESAVGKFDVALKGSLPVDQLTSVWDSETANLGGLMGWKIEKSASADGVDTRDVLIELDKGWLRGTLTINAQSLEIAGLFFKAVPKRVRSGPATYVDLNAFHAEKITIGTDPYSLKGALTLPNGTGPFPGVVLLHDAGPQNLNSTIGPNHPFRDIADGLSSRGIAVLRFNKRTHQYKKALKNVTSLDEDVILDALVAIQFLKARPEVDPNKVFLIGHGLGGRLAPEIATKAMPIAGLVLLAPPGVHPLDSVLTQMRYLQVPADRIAEAEKAVAQYKSGKRSAGGKVVGIPTAYWQDLESRDGVAMAKNLAKPTLILRGERDYQTTAEDLAVWKQGLADLPGVEVNTIPELNHYFMKGQGKSMPDEYETLGHVDLPVIEKIAEFISGSPAQTP
jgi:dienelactone hydrolase